MIKRHYHCHPARNILEYDDGSRGTIEECSLSDNPEVIGVYLSTNDEPSLWVLDLMVAHYHTPEDAIAAGQALCLALNNTPAEFLTGAMAPTWDDLPES